MVKLGIIAAGHVRVGGTIRLSDREVEHDTITAGKIEVGELR